MNTKITVTQSRKNTAGALYKISLKVTFCIRMVRHVTNTVHCVTYCCCMCLCIWCISWQPFWQIFPSLMTSLRLNIAQMSILVFILSISFGS